MMNSDKLVLRSDDLFSVSHTRVGGKARELAVAIRRGFVVPDFVAIDTKVCTLLLEDVGLQLRLIEEIRQTLSSSTFAVRSCALGEDTQAESKAGVFKTLLNVPPEQLGSAIRSVLLDARGKLGGSLEKFSLIIQEFVEPDYAGVLFTRDPRGRRELVVELAQGRGDSVVEGRRQSKILRVPWCGLAPKLSEFPVLAGMLEKLKQIEREKKWPQDIEWCVMGTQFYLLQVRPITSISVSQYQDILWLEELLPRDTFYLYEKNAITEIAPRPSPLSLDILNWLARNDGPVANVYRRKGIKYAATDSLRQVGSELYVDREAELRSLLPAAKFDALTLKPRLRVGKGWLRTLRNIFRLSMLAGQVTPENQQRLHGCLQLALDLPFSKCDFDEALSALERDYEIIFEINLLSGIALRNAESVLKTEQFSITALLESDAQFVSERAELAPLTFAPIEMRGNGLDIADESIFVSRSFGERASAELSAWWQSLSALRRKILSAPILRLVEFARLREGARWLTVRHINRLREIAWVEARRAGFPKGETVLGASIAEIVSGSLNEMNCAERIEKLRIYAGTNFPVRLCNTPEETPSKMLGVSSGRAKGRLIRREQISEKSSSKILFSDSLTPDLAEHFEEIAGIVSSHGGLLSHLAILAREAGIPVITGFQLSQDFAIGTDIEIDGDRGEVKLASQS